MTRPRIILLSAVIVLALLGGLAYEIISTQPVRGALRTCSELFTIANRTDLPDSERLTAARLLCSSRYLEKHPLALAAEGGIVGIPRNLNKNFKAWRTNAHIWICTSNRVGPVYQFVLQDGVWRFDGLVAILRPYGEIVRASEFPEPIAQ